MVVAPMFGVETQGFTAGPGGGGARRKGGGWLGDRSAMMCQLALFKVIAIAFWVGEN